MLITQPQVKITCGKINRITRKKAHKHGTDKKTKQTTLGKSQTNGALCVKKHSNGSWT